MERDVAWSKLDARTDLIRVVLKTESQPAIYHVEATVQKLDSSEARKSAKPVTSVGVPSLPIGVAAMRRARVFSSAVSSRMSNV